MNEPPTQARPLSLAGTWWLVSAWRWFTGPRLLGSAEEFVKIGHEHKSI